MLSVLLTNATNSNEVWELPADQLTINEELNAVRTGQISVNYQDVQQMALTIGTSINYILAGGPRRIVISDSQYDPNPTLFVGVLRDYQFSSNASEPSSVSLNFADLGLTLAKRVGQAYAFYDNVPAGQIFASELAAANAVSDTGLTVASLPTTTSRQRTIEYTNLLDLLMGMSNSKTKDGFDWAVDNNGDVNIYQPTRGGQQTNLVLEARNSLQPQVAGKLSGNLCNKVFVQGGEQTNESGEVTQAALMVIVEDTTSQATWGLHEEYLSATDITTEAFLRQRGQQVLTERAYPTNTETITLQHLGDDPDWRAYEVGDWLKVELDAFNIDEMLRVKKRGITWNNGIYQCNLTLSREFV